MNKMEKFSVLMSLYIKEKPEHFSACIESILSQTVLPDEIVIVLDGPISDELKVVLDSYVEKHPKLFNIIPLQENKGLGLALQEGMLHCKNELIARMDTDDICRKDRFELQLKEFENDLNLDVCGSHILEFEGNRVRRFCGNYICEIEGNKIREFCGNYLYEIEGNLTKQELMFLIAILFY